MSYRARRHEQLMREAREAYAEHVLRTESEGRWLLQRPYADERGGWRSEGWTEIVSLAGGLLYVGGDYRFVIFAGYGQGSHEGKVAWMGRHRSFDDYVHQKACIGTGSELIDTFEADAAAEDLGAWREERLAQLAEENEPADDDELVDEIDHMLHWGVDDPAAALSQLHDAAPDFMSERYHLGAIIAPRLYFAYAALGRLCDLLDARRDAMMQAPQP